MRVIPCIFLFLFFTTGWAQSSELILLKGKVLVKNKGLDDVSVLNMRSEAATYTENGGSFSIFVRVGDTLHFSGLQVVPGKVEIAQKDLNQKSFVIDIETKVNELEEVKIDEFKNINAVSLGILKHAPKRYTPAERHLKTAGDFKPVQLLGIFMGQLPLDPIINAVNGRTKMLKKGVVVERKEKLLQKIENQFEISYFTRNLNIPEGQVRGFWYYAVDDESLVAALNANNKALARFVFSELAGKYLNNLKTTH
ncbi:MAG: hypothetical protein ACI7YS_14675 [Flavobacterium sp.]